MFNQLVFDEDPMDGSRVLRGRKLTSVYSDADSDLSPVRGYSMSSLLSTRSDLFGRHEHNDRDDGMFLCDEQILCLTLALSFCCESV